MNILFFSDAYNRHSQALSLMQLHDLFTTLNIQYPYDFQWNYREK